MLVSVIIATKNEAKNLDKCLVSVIGQSFSGTNIEIIAVDNNSTDTTKRIAGKYTNRVFNTSPERSAQKNFGARQATGTFLFFLDADMTLSRDVLKECVETISNGKNLIALFVPEIVMGEKFFPLVRRFERSFYDGTVIDAVRFIRKETFLESGGFDEKLYAGEDWDLDKRLKKLGKFSIIKSPLYHNEEGFSLSRYLKKKSYYSQNLDAYISKWGKSDPDIKKQFGFCYRFLGVFVENGKWKRLLRHPVLTAGMYFLRILVGIKFIFR
jgi:glycosyltransferase involved in cell wall biosynthesis